MSIILILTNNDIDRYENSIYLALIVTQAVAEFIAYMFRQ